MPEPSPTETPSPTTYAPVSTAAKRYTVSNRTVDRWIANGLIKAYKCGPTLVRIDLAEADRALLRPIPPTLGAGEEV